MEDCNSYEDYRELTPLEQCMANHGYSEDDVIRILNALGDFSSIRTSEFNYEIEKDTAYIEAKDGYTLVFVETGEDYVKIKAVKEKE